MDRDVSAAMLQKIRALLAQAESTTFSAEAEAFTAKAQELMARHRIDRAVLADAGGVEDSDVLTRRIGVDDPYASAKFLLLSGIADANGARALWSQAQRTAVVLGFAVELDIVEELFTSLLVQATAALTREGPKYDAQGRSRTKAFRRSFLVAYASRVSDRLAATVRETVEEASSEAGTDFLPMLAAREGEVDTKIDELYPDLGTMRATVRDREGVFAGQLAANRADLSAGPRLHRRSA